MPSTALSSQNLSGPTSSRGVQSTLTMCYRDSSRSPRSRGELSGSEILKSNSGQLRLQSLSRHTAIGFRHGNLQWK
jgi:hypothetical protein